MLTEFISDLANREGGGLLLDELLHAQNSILQAVVDCVIEALPHREPSTHSEYREAERKHSEIPGRQAEANGRGSHDGSSTRSVYPTPRTV